jgi:hypothetical protein
MSDQLFAEAATYTTNTRERHPRDPRDSNPHPSNQTAADLSTSYTARPPGWALQTMGCSVIEILMQILSRGNFHILCQAGTGSYSTQSYVCLSVTCIQCQGFKNRIRRLRVLEVPLTLLTVLRVHTGTRCWWRSWLRHCATSRKVACSIPDGVIGFLLLK